MSSARLTLIYGAAAFGKEGTNVATINTIEEAQKVVDAFVGFGYHQFDTSNVYGLGTSEEFLGQLNLGKDAIIDTKVLPIQAGDHTPERIEFYVNKSLKSLGRKQVNILYLHAPDRSVPFEDTCRAINGLYKKGAFKFFGLSNYNSWEVAEIYYICKQNGWVLPTVYQGGYNVINRNVETELIPCLRKFGIKFYAYSPLAGGLLTGKFLSTEDFDKSTLPGNRWHSSFKFSERLRKEAEPLLPALGPLIDALKKHNLRLNQVAVRWLQHHSLLEPDDAVVIGARNVEQLRTHVTDSSEGPLPKDILALLDELWKLAKPTSPHYSFDPY